jgi:hypothetical protein
LFQILIQRFTLSLVRLWIERPLPFRLGGPLFTGLPAWVFISTTLIINTLIVTTFNTPYLRRVPSYWTLIDGLSFIAISLRLWSNLVYRYCIFQITWPFLLLLEVSSWITSSSSLIEELGSSRLADRIGIVEIRLLIINSIAFFIYSLVHLLILLNSSCFLIRVLLVHKDVVNLFEILYQAFLINFGRSPITLTPLVCCLLSYDIELSMRSIGFSLNLTINWNDVFLCITWRVVQRRHFLVWSLLVEGIDLLSWFRVLSKLGLLYLIHFF